MEGWQQLKGREAPAEVDPEVWGSVQNAVRAQAVYVLEKNGLHYAAVGRTINYISDDDAMWESNRESILRDFGIDEIYDDGHVAACIALNSDPDKIREILDVAIHLQETHPCYDEEDYYGLLQERVEESVEPEGWFTQDVRLTLSRKHDLDVDAEVVSGVLKIYAAENPPESTSVEVIFPSAGDLRAEDVAAEYVIQTLS